MIRHGVAFKEGNEHNPYSLGFQDSYCCLSAGRIFVGVICDGCSMRGNGSANIANDSSSVRSDCSRMDGFTRNQVGAVLGAEVFSHTILRQISKSIDSNHFDFGLVLKKAVDDTLSFFGCILEAISNATETEIVGVRWDRQLFITDKLMFTLIGIASVDKKYWLFGFGDGCFGSGDSYTTIDTPNVPYISHKLIDPGLQCLPVIHKEGNLNVDTALWVASDGLIPVLENKYSRADFFSFVSDQRTAHAENGVDKTNQAFRSNVLRKKQDILLSDDMIVLVVKWETTDLAFPMMLPKEWHWARGLEKDGKNLDTKSTGDIGQADVTVNKLSEVPVKDSQELIHNKHGGNK